MNVSTAMRRHPWRAISVLAAVAASAIALSGCSASSPQESSAKTLTWAIDTTPRSLFAPTDYSTLGSTIMSLVQGQLLTLDDSGALAPGVASSWKATDDTTYVYTIDSGATFSDGNAVTADDVAYSLNLNLDQSVGSEVATLFSDVKSVAADGDKVTVKLNAPSSLWKYIPSSIGGYVWEKSSVEANLKSYGTPEVLPIGSGPYKVSQFVADDHITLVRNPKFVGKAPQYDTVTFPIISDAQTRLLALKSGEIDGTFAVPTDSSAAQWKAAGKVTPFPGLIWRGLTLDMTQAPFDDIHVRKALYYATDRKAIADGLYSGFATPSTAVNDPSVFAGSVDQTEVDASYSKIESFDYDIDKAKGELAKSSEPSGFTVTMNVPQDSPGLVSIAQVLKESWAKIGIDLELNLMDGGPRFQLILDHGPNLGIQMIGNLPDVPDPVEMATEYLNSNQAVVNGNNSSNYSNPQVDSLLNKAEQSTDPTDAAKLVLQAQEIASKDVPVIPIVWQNSAVAVKKGGSVDTLGAFYSSSVWINKIHLP